MTLCAAWVRQAPNDEGEELIFVTDSRLGGGEEWDTGIKLFDLGRADCLLCFAGMTHRAYPLILQGGNSERFDIEWSNPRLDLHDVLESLCKSFTHVCRTVVLPANAAFMTGHDKAEFMFGGWSWQQQKFRLWRLYYSPELRAITHQALHPEGNGRVCSFLGDEIDSATNLLTEALKINNRVFAGVLDMEPLQIVAHMARDEENYHSIGGSLQFAKVYRSGHSEFFGVMWPSVMNGKPSFRGREINPYDAPPIRLLDPDSGKVVEKLPARLHEIERYIERGDFGPETQFVKDSYPNKEIRPDLRAVEANRLHRIFKDVAYREFVKQHESSADVINKGADREGRDE